MSGHSQFAPIGNHNQPIPMPPVGGVGNDANQPENVQQVQQQGQPVVEEPNPPAARSLAQKLDSMLLKAATMAAKSVDNKSIAEATKTLKLSEADRDSLSNAVAHARRTLRIVSDFTGREIASAFVADERGVFDWKQNDTADAIRRAIDAQGDLSALLHGLLERPGLSGKAFDCILELALQCDRRQSEIATLSMQLADAAAKMGDDLDVAARFDAKLSVLLPRQVLEMHGNAEALEKMKATLQPLADRLEKFAARPNASLTSDEFTTYAIEVKDVCNTLTHAVTNGFPAPDGKSRVIPDRDFISSLVTLAKSADKSLQDVRKNIGESVLEHFLEKNIAISPKLGVASPEHSQLVEREAPLLAEAIRTRAQIKNAALEFMEDPDSPENLDKLNELVCDYVSIDQSDMAQEVRSLYKYYNEIMDADGWKKLDAIFSPGLSSIRSQVSHFVQMVKSIRTKMTPEQFLSTTSARALLEGKLMFSTLVEARIHGMSDADVDPALDDSNMVKSETLGSGKVNTVKLVTYKNGTEYVFKPEAPGRQAMEGLTLSQDYDSSQMVAQLNMATQSAAKSLGLDDVIPKCTVGMHNGEYGLFMEKVPGIEASDFAKGKAMPNGGLSAKDVAKLDDVQHAKVIGGLMRGINRLEWLDLITGQGDRHGHNYMVSVGKDLTVIVKGIDNDQCFTAYRKGLRTYVVKGKHAKDFMSACNYIISNYPKGLQGEVRERLFKDPGVRRDDRNNIHIDTTKFQAGELHYAARQAIGMHGATLPDFIDAELYEQLMSMKAGEKRDAYFADLSGRLSKKAVESARSRLDEAIAHAEKLFNERRVVAKDDFEKKDVQQSLLSREVNADNPVKPVGNFQLQRKEGVEVKKCVVSVARLQTSSIFMRDMYGRVNKKGWFKK